MASRMAVPPRESIFAIPSSSLLMSLVNGTSSQGSSLKLTMKTSSCGLEAFTRSSDATSTFCRFSFMLPLLSMMMPSDTGTSSRLKILMGCSTPFSKTLKDFCGRSVTSLPLLSATLTGRMTRRVSARKTGSSTGGGCALCAKASEETNKKLLRRRIVPETEKGLQRGKAARLNQFHVHVPILPVPCLILGGVVKHVLVPQLDADFRGNVSQFVHVLYIITSPAR